MICPCRTSRKRISIKKRRQTKRKKRRSIKKRFPSRTEKQRETDAEDLRRLKIKEERTELEKNNKTIRNAGYSGLIIATLYAIKKYKQSKHLPFVIMKKNGMKGYYNKKDEWNPRPKTIREFRLWERIRKRNVKFIHELIFALKINK